MYIYVYIYVCIYIYAYADIASKIFLASLYSESFYGNIKTENHS